MQIDTNWYWNEQLKHHFIIVQKRTILHPQLEVNTVTDFHSISTSVCTRTQAENSISRQPIYLTDFDYDYILEVICRRDAIDFKRDVEFYSDDMED